MMISPYMLALDGLLKWSQQEQSPGFTELLLPALAEHVRCLIRGLKARLVDDEEYQRSTVR